VSNVCNSIGSAVRGNFLLLTMPGGSTGSVSTDPTHKLSLANVRDGHIKIKNLKKDQLNELCATFFDHIEDLELRLEKSPLSNKDYELRAELKELKDAVLVDENGINAMGDKPTGSLTQAYWASGDKRAIPWDIINKFAEDNPGKTSSEEDDVKGAVNATPARSTQPPLGRTTSRARPRPMQLPARQSWPSWPSWSRWPSPRTCGACRRLSRCRRRPWPSRGRSAR
jgi:hypothetical protein